MPILKQLVSGSSQSKRRSRADLTAEMISAPLGDFRHTMHVGRGGDAFGDTSFLSSRSGEPPREPQTQQNSPKQGLISRTFRSSKRSQSANRPDKNDSKIPSSSGSPGYVKTAISLPYLNNEEATKEGPNLAKSVSCSPDQNLPEVGQKTTNFATGLDPELDEHNFGVLTDLPVSLPPLYGGGMKHAESILSFHVDLGPSMLGDILSVMDKKGCDETSFGFEEDLRSSSAHTFKPLEKRAASPLEPINFHGQSEHQHLESCSMSSSGSADDNHNHSTDSIRNRTLEDRDFTYMDEDDDDDEIRV